MNSLTERYLAAALRGIPDKQRPDVERELRSSIDDAVEDRLAAGEDRVTAETAVLEGLGDPTRLSAGLTGRALYLIGPAFFLQWRQLVLTLLAIVVPIVAVVLAGLELSRDGGYADAIAAGLSGALATAVQIVFWVTAVFAVLERIDSVEVPEIRAATGPWTVQRLPDLPATGRPSVAETVGEIVTVLISIGGLLFASSFAWFTDVEGATISLFSDTMNAIWLPVLIALYAALAGFHLVKHLVGRWTMQLAATHGALQLAIGAIFVGLALAGMVVNPAFAAEVGWPPLADGTGPVMVWASVGVALVTGWEVWDGFRMARRATRGPSASVPALSREH
jgi:hypothetical protein